MGDLKDAAQSGDGSKAKTQENMETVDIESAQTLEQTIEQRTLAANAEMAALLANPLYCLPKSVRRNVRALKKLQLEHVLIEVDFFKELHDLEIKYEKKFNPLYEKRTAIVTGAYLPTEDECDYQSDNEKEIELADAVQKVKVEDEDSGEKGDGNEPVKGIPEFWLTALKNAPAIADMIEEYDEPILKHLIDIKAETYKDPMSFLLEFHFESNEYFTNTVLTKFYELKCSPDETDIFAFEGPEIVKSKGCTIDWKKNKNVTVKTIKKKQKHKARGAVRTVTKTVTNDSFFNFFSPPVVPENEEDLDEEAQGILNNDFEVGNLIKDRIIPHAVLFFTGENLVDDDFDEEDDEGDEEDFDEDEEEEEEDDDENDNQCLNRKKSRGQSGNTQQQAPPECKQQ
ncbi:nucleosome assembly protein 1-like 1 [Argiope bruennichi]|uniref:Nucleosome assembly protein 1-like 4 like protein n=1 Tax=Argiope bruennichi TaxID=94029 RepID=A0A8T0F803_ARGBR|nr:nucleosome assembly protein 1-like 1 [Argiope bruennichi]XP_055941174.1 nucleosome assembly protein 1-like 1 [Argiope bruennichi]KAF8786355.1 Nucleosome assembly protein 1-like 4 like protein [Argiope bruennichi]